MTRLFLFLFFWSVSVGHADEGLLTSLKSKNFVCTSFNDKGCSYSECLGKVPGYPKSILITIPATPQTLRIHFHGHILGHFPEYEKDLSSMIRAFALSSSLCQSKEVTVFPASSGKCETYDKVLRDGRSMENFVDEIYSALGQKLPMHHFSAHSGGGRTISGLLKAGISVKKITLFDGVYAEAEKETLKRWYQTNEGDLILATVKGMSPDKFSTQLRNELKLVIDPSELELGGSMFKVLSGQRFIQLSRSIGQDTALKAHYDVLSQTWAFLP